MWCIVSEGFGCNTSTTVIQLTSLCSSVQGKRVQEKFDKILSAADRWHRLCVKQQRRLRWWVYLTATQDAGLAEGGRGFPGLEGSWWSCWVEGESFPEQRWGEPGKRHRRVPAGDLKVQILYLCASACAYLQKSWRHGWVVEATEGSRGGRRSETWHPREGQQTREGTTSWTLKSATEPEACRAITVTCS